MDQQENNLAVETQEWELPEDFLLCNLDYNSNFNTYNFPDNHLKFFNFQNNIPIETPEETREKEKAIQDQVRLGILRVANSSNSASIPYHPSLNVYSTPPILTVMNGKPNVALNKNTDIKDNKKLNSILTQVLNPVKPIDMFATKTGKNDQCPCGSGKKFKKCHGR